MTHKNLKKTLPRLGRCRDHNTRTGRTCATCSVTFRPEGIRLGPVSWVQATSKLLAALDDCGALEIPLLTGTHADIGMGVLSSMSPLAFSASGEAPCGVEVELVFC